MLNLNPPSAVNPEVDTLCDHVNEIAIEGEEGAGEEFKVAPLTPSPMETSDEECKTPRGEEYKIPEITSCPPAPKRPRNMRNLPADAFSVMAKLDNSPEMQEEYEEEEDCNDDGDDDDVIAPSEINWPGST